ncbi:MAG: hypothetical protein ACRDPA_18525, partial [Solirubrobacteraceae bacterium]
VHTVSGRRVTERATACVAGARAETAPAAVDTVAKPIATCPTVGGGRCHVPPRPGVAITDAVCWAALRSPAASR